MHLGGGGLDDFGNRLRSAAGAAPVGTTSRKLLVLFVTTFCTDVAGMITLAIVPEFDSL
jgi:hypothetical protein